MFFTFLFFSGCGGDLVMESGAFNSPNYPDPYPPNVECVWTIRSSPGNRLQLSFMLVNLSVEVHFWPWKRISVMRYSKLKVYLLAYLELSTASNNLQQIFVLLVITINCIPLSLFKDDLWCQMWISSFIFLRPVHTLLLMFGGLEVIFLSRQITPILCCC